MTPPAHGGVAVPCSGFGCCSTCPFFSPAGDYTGFDTFQYRYNTGTTDPPSNTATVTLLLIGNNDDQNAGAACPIVGQPVNVTNGNMCIQQRDFTLPGLGEFIEVNRFYNSIIQTPGLFGFGWSTRYDESLQFYDDRMIRLNQSDGRAVYFGRMETTEPFFSFSPGVVGEIVPNEDGTYTLTHNDGSSRKFGSNGKLLSARDRNGNVTALNYDSNGHLTTVTDPGGRTLTLVPNADGTISQIGDFLGPIADYEYFPNTTLLKTVTYADGSAYKFEYTTIGSKTLLTTVKDALDNILERHEYDTAGRATTSEKNGGVEKYLFDFHLSNVTTVTDALGRITNYFYTRTYGTNLITRTEGLCGSCGSGSEVTLFEYDDRLNLIRTIDALGWQTLSTYDIDRNITKVVDPLGTRKWTYNSLGQVLTYKDRVDSLNLDPNVNTTVNTYDSAGNLLTTTDALNNTTTLTYTPVGQLATITDAKNNNTTLSWDSQGRLAQIMDANSRATGFGYDARARLTSTTNALNETTSFEYDLNNRLKKVIYPDTNFITYAYDLAGRRTAATDARGNATNYGYDGAYRLTSVTDPLNHAALFGYDLMSNLTLQTDALGNETNFEYDDFDRLKKVINPLATLGATRLEESLTYDKLGNVKTRVDSAGRTTAYDYDTSNRLIKITDALNSLTQFEYNTRSQMTKVKDALNQEYVFTYDALGRQLTQTRAGTTMSFEYDSVGNRTKRIDYMGQVTDYQYDNLNRLTSILYAGTIDSTYGYDDLSRMISAANGAGTVLLTYDNRSRLKSETDVYGHLMEFGYDANGNRTQLKLDGAVHTGYAHDAANRLTTLTDDAGQNFTYGYDIANRLISKALPNGVTTTYEYDGMSRLTRLRHQTLSNPILDSQYSYNAANQISQIADLAQTRDFTYDNIDRIISMTNGISNENYSFDAVGNRTSSHLSASYTTEPFNRLTATANSTMTYDANGNMTGKSDGTVNSIYNWDFENRMTSTSRILSTVDYRYDALGRRVKRTKSSWGKPAEEVGEFVYDGQDVVHEYETTAGKFGSSTAINDYQNGPGIDNKLSMTTNGAAAKYFLQDHLGSTTALTDSTGGVADSINYDSFGLPGIKMATRCQYTGREFDNQTGLYYYRARWYDPTIGRFVSEDPIGFEGEDVNLYVSVWNSPLKYSDPAGLAGYDFLERLNEARNRAEQSIIEGLETPISFVVGFGDTASGGITSYIRQLQGIENVNWNCSSAYNIGGWAAVGAEVATGIGGIAKVGFKAAARRGAKTVIEEGTHVVYRGLDDAGIVRYVGSTGREAAIRFKEHGRAIGTGRELLQYRVIDGATGLTRMQARRLEQTLINEYGLQRNGGLLLNRINAIASRFW